MVKTGWVSEKCRYCSKNIKFNAKNNGACKIQLQTHELSCAHKNNKIFTNPVDNYIINNPPSNVKVKSVKVKSVKVKPVNAKPPINPPTSQSLNIPTIIGGAKNLKLKSIKYYSFETVPDIWLWYCGNDIWYPYTLEIQNHIIQCIENKEEINFNILKTSSFNNKEQCFTIALDVTNQCQLITHINYLEYMNPIHRPIKIIKQIQNNPKIIQELKDYYPDYWIKSKLFRDPIQNIQYSFSRNEISINNWDKILIPTNNTARCELVNLISTQDSTIKIHKIFQIQNANHSEQFKNTFEKIYDKYHYKLKTGDCIKKENDTPQTIANENLKYLNIAKTKVADKFVDKLNVYNLGLIPMAEIAFHGAFQSENINNICEEGFEPMLNNKAVYGTGTYFAKNVRYVNRNGYSASLGKNIYHFFVCKICPGSYCTGDNMQKLPNKLGEIKRFQSFVNNMVAPTIWAIREKHQIEILYEIHYSLDEKVDVKYDLPELFIPNDANNIGLI